MQGGNGVGGNYSLGDSLEAVAICTGRVVAMLKDCPLEIDVDLKTLRTPVRLPEDSSLPAGLAISQPVTAPHESPGSLAGVDIWGKECGRKG